MQKKYKKILNIIVSFLVKVVGVYGALYYALQIIKYDNLTVFNIVLLTLFLAIYEAEIKLN